MTTINPIGMMNSLNNVTSKTGFGGLISGMDLDDLVVGLTSTGRLKIAKEQQTVQSLEWKQDAYRAVTKALEEFQRSYLDILSPNNLKRSALFASKAADVSSSLVSVIPSSNAMTGNFVIDKITQLADSQRITSGASISSPLVGELDLEGMSDVEFAESLEGKAISLSLDGRVRTISFDGDFVANAGDNGLESALQQAIDKAFGVAQGSEGVIKVNINEGKLSIKAEGSELIARTVGGDEATLAKLGFSDGQGNKLSLYTKLESLSLTNELEAVDGKFEFTINGVEFSFGPESSLMDIVNKVNSSDAGVTMSYSSLSDKFSIVSKETGAGEHIVLSEGQGNLLSSLGLTQAGGANIEYGKNAILTVNGIDIERSANIFSVDGISIELHGVTEAGASPININVRDDSSSVREPIESFIKDYNALVDLIDGLISEKVNKNYPPLTDEQKNEMSEKQVEQWEAKAKEGILANDPALRSLLSDLRSNLTGAAKAGGISLTEMGITTGNYLDKGKLTISDEAKFAEALKTKGNAIAELFADAEKGIAAKLQKTLDSAIKKSGPANERGRLIKLAGAEKSTSEKENSITKMIEQANKRIDDLKLRLGREEQRLWARFTAMETALSRMEAQSSMLMQFSFNG